MYCFERFVFIVLILFSKTLTSTTEITTSTSTPTTSTSTSTPTTSTSTSTPTTSTSTSTPTTSTSTSTPTTSTSTSTPTTSTSTSTTAEDCIACPYPFYGLCCPCIFYPQCYCANVITNYITDIICLNANVFPNFPINNGNYQINSQIIIEGDFPYIPKNAFENVLNMGFWGGSLLIVLKRTNLTTFPVKIFPGALNLPHNIVAKIEFSNFFLPSIPTEAFAAQGGSGSTLMITSSFIEYLTDYSFVYVTCNGNYYGLGFDSIDLSNNQIKSIDIDAFFLCGAKSFDVSYNLLTEISPAFKTAPFFEVHLQNNKISDLTDYAFSPCNIDKGCENSNLNFLDLSNNPLQKISAKAFSNLPYLHTLYLKNISIASFSLPLPLSVLQPLKPSIETLDLSNNQIEYLEVNSFSQFSSLSTLNLYSNPIVGIAPGAFANDTNIRQLNFEQLPLTYVDLLVSYQMSNVNTLSFYACPYLTNIILTDASKLPLSLISIQMRNNNIRSVDSQVQYFLYRNSNNYIDFSGNYNFNCNPTIAWMKPYVPHQIVNTDSVKCAGTGQTLTSYLNSLS